MGAVAVGVGLSVASCSGEIAKTDGGTDAAAGADADAGPIAAYGPPPWWDASVSDAASDADGGVAVMYGPPPPQDSGGD